ncbi:hypothetical protein [Cohaesibacter gelatinilyticus]|uniref:Toxic anion resistance protein (TelA) n=1 Tax=Cohaesibacter gelatinilyticus TaxID=372072 RepID=A0A285PBH4_9HYPH|nr:hypothetical protein [Cohaesibacter gelatinilyticus]SNZ19075.1 hypothetical protein SAMN06265368_2153 [Cohaesibacter gelatinilyticus]
MQSAYGEIETSSALNDDQLLPNILDENAVLALDEAAATKSLDTDLLSTTPVVDIRMQIETILSLLQKVDHRKLLSRQSAWARLTGKNIEARLEFELAAQNVLNSVSHLLKLAETGQHVLLLLKQSFQDIQHEQERLNCVIQEAKDLLIRSPSAEDFVISRFERRLSNIMALHAANSATLQQISLAEQTLHGTLDRVTDVRTLLVPLWQRNVLALAQASIGHDQRKAADDFAQTHHQFIEYLA